MQPMSIQLLLGLVLVGETSPWVIPPGREGVLVQMLDVKGLPTGCTLAGADPVKNLVQVLYTCDPGGKTSVKLELVHPEDAPKNAAARTERFGIVARTATPAGLVDAVAAQIRQHESRFEWVHTADAPSTAPSAPKFPLILVVGAGALLLAAVAALLVRRNAAVPKR